MTFCMISNNVYCIQIIYALKIEKRNLSERMNGTLELEYKNAQELICSLF